jgi:hypothetical protein
MREFTKVNAQLCEFIHSLDNPIRSQSHNAYLPLYSSLFVTALGDVFGMYLLYEMDNHKQMQAKNQNE